MTVTGSAQYSTGPTTAAGTVAGRARIDVPTVLADLQAAVAERGDGFVYVPPEPIGAECVYVEEGPDGEAVPSCIVGHVFARHGLLTRLYAVDNVAIRGGTDDFFEDFTPHAVAVLGAAQKVQDDGRSTWGDALIAAKEVAASQDGDSDGT